jgi:hypothetical protein
MCVKSLRANRLRLDRNRVSAPLPHAGPSCCAVVRRGCDPAQPTAEAVLADRAVVPARRVDGEGMSRDHEAGPVADLPPGGGDRRWRLCRRHHRRGTVRGVAPRPAPGRGPGQRRPRRGRTPGLPVAPVGPRRARRMDAARPAGSFARVPGLSAASSLGRGPCRVPGADPGAAAAPGPSRGAERPPSRALNPCRPQAGDRARSAAVEHGTGPGYLVLSSSAAPGAFLRIDSMPVSAAAPVL